MSSRFGRYAPAIKGFLYGGAALIVFKAVSLAVPYSLAVNLTPSIAEGIYLSHRDSAGSLKRGDIACFPYRAPEWAKPRNYLPEGMQLCKFVAGLPGDKVFREGNKLLVTASDTNETRIWGEFAATDSRNRPLPQDAVADGEVPAATFLLMAPRHATSLDSRYLGFIPARIVTERLTPLLTW